MKSIRTLVTALGIIGAVPALVSAQEAPSTDPTAILAGSYKLESNHARILFSVSHFGFSTWYGEFPRATGTATFDPRNPAADSVDITIPADNISTSNAKLDSELKGPEWFDTAKYPTMTFKSRMVEPTGPGTFEVLGDLTMHGVTRPVTLLVKFNMGGVNRMSHAFTVGYDATAKLHRSDFGVSKFAPMIGDEVNIIISVPFEKVK